MLLFLRGETKTEVPYEDAVSIISCAQKKLGCRVDRSDPA